MSYQRKERGNEMKERWRTILLGRMRVHDAEVMRGANNERELLSGLIFTALTDSTQENLSVLWCVKLDCSLVRILRFLLYQYVCLYCMHVSVSISISISIYFISNLSILALSFLHVLSFFSSASLPFPSLLPRYSSLLCCLTFLLFSSLLPLFHSLLISSLMPHFPSLLFSSASLSFRWSTDLQSTRTSTYTEEAPSPSIIWLPKRYEQYNTCGGQIWSSFHFFILSDLLSSHLLIFSSYFIAVPCYAVLW